MLPAIIVTFCVIVQLSLFINNSLINIVPVILIQVASIFYVYLPNLSYFKKLIKSNILLILYILIIILGIFRDNLPTANKNVTILQAVLLASFFVFFSGTTYFFLNKKSNKSQYIKVFIFLITLPFTILAILNFALYLQGVNFSRSVFTKDEGTYQAVLLHHMGLDLTRVEFPLADGLNNYGSYIGGIFVLALTAAVLTKKYRPLTVSTCIICCTTLLYIDSRASLFYPIILSLILYFLRNKKSLSYRLNFISLIVVFGPLIFMYLLPLLATVPGLEIIARNGQDVESGSGRFTIWKIALDHLLDFKIMDFIGYGAYGHYGSGVSYKWAYLFNGWQNSEMKSPHNTFFSILFDYGYIGLIIYVSLLFQLINRIREIWKQQPVIAGMLLGYIIYNIAAGISEVLEGVYFFNYLILFIMIASFINALHYIIKNSTVIQLTNKPITNVD